MSVSLTLRRDKSMALLFATEEFSERQHSREAKKQAAGRLRICLDSKACIS